MSVEASTGGLVPLNPAAIEQASPGLAAEMVTAALAESLAWLTKAMQGTDPTPIAEFRAWAATVAEAVRQKNLGHDIEMDATEMVRRAERGIGVAIRKGQEAGEIKTQGQRGGHSPGSQALRVDSEKLTPTDFGISATELSGNHSGIYRLADGVTDEQFADALTEARAEQNLSRANVVRKVKAKAPKDEPPPPAPSHGKARKTKRPELLRNRRHIDPNRVIEVAVNNANPDAGGILAEVDFTALDHAQLETWISSLSSSIYALTRLRNQLKKELNRREPE